VDREKVQLAPGNWKEAMNNHRIRSRRCKSVPRAAVVCGVCLAGANVFAQEAINESAAVDQSRHAHKEAIDRNLYNLKAGPVLMRFEALMGFEFNDNPQLVEHPKEVDFAFHPEVDVAALWALNARNSLALNLGIGYIKYVNNTDLDHIIIAPSSEIALDIYSGDVAINLHERVSYTQNPLNDPTVSGTGDFGGIENTVGTRVDWDLNRLVSWIGYDHYNFISTSSGVTQSLQPTTATRVKDVQDRSSELFYGRVGLKLSPAITTGFEAGGSLTDYESNFFHDNSQFSVGPFVEVQVSQDLKTRAAGGYVRSEFDSNGVTPTPDPVDDFYAELSVDHQLSQYMDHRLSVGREAKSGAEAELVTLWFARYQNNWKFSRLATLHGSMFYENGRERSGVTERLWRAGGTLGMTVPLSRQLNVGAQYQIIYKDSDQANRNYLQNLVSLELHYVF
jgi:hypothetical protein